MSDEEREARPITDEEHGSVVAVRFERARTLREQLIADGVIRPGRLPSMLPADIDARPYLPIAKP